MSEFQKTNLVYNFGENVLSINKKIYNYLKLEMFTEEKNKDP